MTEEEAKAAQEIAKAASQGINALEKTGGYLSKYIDGPLEQAIGIVEDRLKYYRWERKSRLFDRANEFLKNRGMTSPTAPVPLKIALPILEAGSIEDDDDIQDIYAQILANAADIKFELKIKRTYIDVLQNLSGIEINILKRIYSFNFEEIWNEGVWMTTFPLLSLGEPPQQENLRPP
ncbi:MAG: Abi-alpha family protein [Methylobacter sp.]